MVDRLAALMNNGNQLKHGHIQMSAAILLGLLLLSPPARAGRPDIGTILAAARAQMGVTVHYDPSYRSIAYPGGDVPIDRGVCTDVIIRAYRAAGVDLQRLVHDDMLAAFDAYPALWGLSRPDSNIDHRRVPNLVTFFARKGVVLPVSAEASAYSAGDIVTWRLSSGVPHIGLVSESVDNGRPLILHNIGAGVQLEAMLFSHAITGHFRYDP